MEADHEKLIVLFRRIDHRLSFFRVHRHRLFDDNRETLIQRVDTRLRVEVIRRADIDGIELHVLEHFLVIGERLLNAELLFDHLERWFAHVRSRDDFHVVKLREETHVMTRNAAGTDESDANLLTSELLRH